METLNRRFASLSLVITEEGLEEKAVEYTSKMIVAEILDAIPPLS